MGTPSPATATTTPATPTSATVPVLLTQRLSAQVCQTQSVRQRSAADSTSPSRDTHTDYRPVSPREAVATTRSSTTSSASAAMTRLSTLAMFALRTPPSLELLSPKQKFIVHLP